MLMPILQGRGVPRDLPGGKGLTQNTQNSLNVFSVPFPFGRTVATTVCNSPPGHGQTDCNESFFIEH